MNEVHQPAEPVLRLADVPELKKQKPDVLRLNDMIIRVILKVNRKSALFPNEC